MIHKRGNTPRFLSVAFVGVLLSSLIGCSSLNSPVANVKVVSKSTAALTIVHPLVYTDGTQAVLSGSLRGNSFLGHGVSQAHFQITVLDVTGKTLSESVANVPGLPLLHERFGAETLCFSVSLPLIPPTNGTVLLVLHHGSAKQ